METWVGRRATVQFADQDETKLDPSVWGEVARTGALRLAGFRFDWDGDAGLLQQETAAYPGDTYVDIVGLDVYDKGLPVAWDPPTASWSDPEAAFQWELSNLRFQRDFAVSHHKQVSYPEWGLAGVNAPATRQGRG